MSLVETLAELGHDWTPPPNQNSAHPLLSAKRDGSRVHVSGQVPVKDGKVIAGKVGSTVSLPEAQAAAKLCALHCLYAAGSVVKPEDIVGVIEITVFVNCAPGFNNTSEVANGASNFFIRVLGDEGKHARAAIGVAELPLDAAVEITAVIAIQ